MDWDRVARIDCDGGKQRRREGGRTSEKTNEPVENEGWNVEPSAVLLLVQADRDVTRDWN